MELRPRNKVRPTDKMEINYSESGIKRESPPIPYSREPYAECKLRPEKLITYQRDQSFPPGPSDDGNQRCSSRPRSRQAKKRKLSLGASLSLLLSDCDTSNDENEYTSLREENTTRRFNILKDMGLLNRGRGGHKRTKVMQKCTNSDMVEKNSDVIKINEEENKLASMPDSGNENEEEYTTQRRRRMAERRQNLRTMSEEEEMCQKVNVSMVTSTPIILIPRIPEQEN